MDLLKFKNLSKTKQQQVCRDILYREKYSDSRTVLSGEDLNIMLNVFSNHPNPRKLDNLAHIIVKQSAYARRFTTKKQVCFHTIKKDGSIEDISFTECFIDSARIVSKKEYATDLVLDIPDTTKDIIRNAGLPQIPYIAKNIEHYHTQHIPLKYGTEEFNARRRNSDYSIYFLYYNSEMYYVGSTSCINRRIFEDEHQQIHWYDKTYYNYITLHGIKDRRAAESVEYNFISTIVKHCLFPLKNKVRKKRVKHENL